jgi:RNA polymerase sigma-70 factor (ECF subfamily)
MAEDARTNDAALAGRIRDGDLTAFEELYRVHASRLYNVAWRLLGNAADAEDALQETFLQAFRRIGTYRGDAAIGTWLYRLATNLCLDRVRSRAAREDRRTEALNEAGPVAVATSATLGAMTRVDLERAIGRLPDGYRAAFVLHDVEGFEHREVAAILGVSEGTSKSQVHKARMKLREWLRR